jgi:hypothetical protein
MSLTWKDGMATALVGAAVLNVLFQGGTAVAGLSGPRALSVAIFALGIGGCYSAKSHIGDVYGVTDRARPPLVYVVLVSVLGGVTLCAGVVAIFGGSAGALATLTVAMVVLWAAATIRHSVSSGSQQRLHTAR